MVRDRYKNTPACRYYWYFAGHQFITVWFIMFIILVYYWCWTFVATLFSPGFIPHMHSMHYDVSLSVWCVETSWNHEVSLVLNVSRDFIFHLGLFHKCTAYILMSACLFGAFWLHEIMKFHWQTFSTTYKRSAPLSCINIIMQIIYIKGKNMDLFCINIISN